MKRAPDFWRRDGVIARLLAPLGALYGAIAQRRLAQAAPHARAPTIVIGGPTIGGDGKTPLALAIAARLLAMGEKPAFLTRGFGAVNAPASPFVVDLARHDANATGDEALLLARAATTIVGADRVASAALARENGASVLVLDDGFHSRRLAPDLSLLAIDADYGVGNGRCLPAGPLRAPLDAQLAAADALIVIGAKEAPAFVSTSGKPVLAARIVPTAPQIFSGVRVVAFAGIARPEKFFRTLSETGAHIVATRAFGDHHRFTDADYAELEARAVHQDAALVTTQKDATRLDARRLAFETLPVVLEFDEPEALDALLREALAKARINRPLS